MRKIYFAMALLFSVMLLGCRYPTYETYETYEVYETYETSIIDEYSLEYIKENEKLGKTFTYVYHVHWDYHNTLVVTYDVTEFYESHFIAYSYCIFDLDKLDDVKLVKFRTGDFKEVADGYVLKYAREYDTDFNKYFSINTKEELTLYQKYMWSEHYIENRYDNKKITITFTTPNNVLTDYTETGYFEIYNLKLKVEDCEQ